MNNTETANVETANVETAAPKVAKTATITLRAADGLMQIVAERKADNSAKTYVLMTDADKKTSRGVTANHPTFEAAKAATEKMAAKAVKLGWQRSEARRAFVAKPDAFSDIPAPPKAAAPASTPTKKEKK